jgi:hypothetical protein
MNANLTIKSPDFQTFINQFFALIAIPTYAPIFMFPAAYTKALDLTVQNPHFIVVFCVHGSLPFPESDAHLGQGTLNVVHVLSQ